MGELRSSGVYAPPLLEQETVGPKANDRGRLNDAGFFVPLPVLPFMFQYGWEDTKKITIFAKSPGTAMCPGDSCSGGRRAS